MLPPRGGPQGLHDAAAGRPGRHRLPQHADHAEHQEEEEEEEEEGGAEGGGGRRVRGQGGAGFRATLRLEED